MHKRTSMLHESNGVQRFSTSRQGQAIVEYLVLATIVLAAIIVMKPMMAQAVNTLFDQTATQANSVAAAVGTFQVP